MPSSSYQALLVALHEIDDLLSSWSPGRLSQHARMRTARVLGRSGVVLLCSHFERYFYRVNDEACAFAESQQVSADLLPLSLRLMHSRVPIDSLIEVQWTNREDKLKQLIELEGWLWNSAHPRSALDSSRLLVWMKSPKPRALVRLYKVWGVDDIFSAITRSEHTKGEFWLQLKSLVDKRNNIAHGDDSENATASDIRRYRRLVRLFCERADKVLSRQVARTFNSARPW